MNNEVNDNIVFLDKNKKYKKIGIALLGVLIIIAFIFLLDYLSVLFFSYSKTISLAFDILLHV